MTIRTHLHLLFLIFVFALSNCKPKKDETPTPNPPVQEDPKGSVVLNFHLTSNGTPLVLEQDAINSSGDTFTIRQLAYYLSNFSLKKSDGSSISIPDSYFLIETGIKESITLSVPRGEYTELSFLVGVDSLKTASGAHKGDLDPIKGMYWSAWAMYINFMFEGVSPSSKSPGKLFKYHVAGYEHPYSTLQTVSRTLPTPLIVGTNDTNRVNYSVDIQKFFQGTSTLSIKMLSTFEDLGPTAKAMSENYKEMFQIQSVTK